MEHSFSKPHSLPTQRRTVKLTRPLKSFLNVSNTGLLKMTISRITQSALSRWDTTFFLIDPHQKWLRYFQLLEQAIFKNLKLILSRNKYAPKASTHCEESVLDAVLMDALCVLLTIVLVAWQVISFWLKVSVLARSQPLTLQKPTVLLVKQVGNTMLQPNHVWIVPSTAKAVILQMAHLNV